MPAPVTSVTAPSTVYCFAVTAHRRPRRCVLPPNQGVANWRPPFFRALLRHGVIINTNLACRFPRSPPCPHLLAAALIQSGVALSTTVLGVYFPWPDRWRVTPISVRHPPMPCAHATPMGIRQSRWLRTAPTALLFVHGRRGRHRHQRTMLWTQRPHCYRLGKPSR